MTSHRAFLDATLPHLDAIHNLARRMTPDVGLAEDLVQETYLRAFRGFARHRGGDVRSWLIAICLNTARSQWRRGRPAEDLRSEPDAGRPGPDDVAEQALAGVERAALVRGLWQLPEVQRISIALVDLAGLTAQEAAELLSCPRGTVLARVHRGRRALARLLARERAARDA